MIFLKRIEANGFKSYADHIVLNFNQSMIGIVGPNGSGKSNVIDAIKWVLGEKSNKTLRGKKGSDMIFHGSETKKASEFAEVTLVFDNSSAILASDEKEIVVTRKLYRNDNNNEYFINHKQVRLKDIYDMFLDTGLSKGSLGIISQGTVNWFADSKPEDRKKIFEEAAGIGRYIKHKDESLKQLDRAQSNYNRLADIVKELNRDIKKLTEQVEKVKKFLELKQELKKLELTILVSDISNCQTKLAKANEDLEQSKNSNSSVIPEINRLEQLRKMFFDQANVADNTIFQNNRDLDNISTEINKLEIKKSTIENTNKDLLQSSDANVKKNALLMTIKNINYELNSKKELLATVISELEQAKNNLHKFAVEKDNVQAQYIFVLNELASKKSMLATINDFLRNSDANSAAKHIIENKNALTGIHCLVKDAFSVEEKYENAICAALGPNINNIIVNTSNNAKKAIQFLKDNEIGSATFIPIYDVKPKYISPDLKNIACEISGFVAIAADLIELKNELFKNPLDMLLAKIIIAQNMDSAITISQYTKKIYRVVTLDGDSILPGGIIKGGYSNNKFIAFNSDQKKQTIINEIASLEQQLTQSKLALEKAILNVNDFQSKINDKQIIISKYQETITNLEKNLARYEAEMQNVSSNDSNYEAINIENYEAIINKLNILYKTKANLIETININQEKSNELKNKNLLLDNEIKNLRIKQDENNQAILKNEAIVIRCEAIVNNAREKINSTYQMSIEKAALEYSTALEIPEQQARERIITLNNVLLNMGNLNMQALDELNEKKSRYDEYVKELQEAEIVRKNIIEVITKADEKAIIDYQNVIDKINQELPEIFSYLFGGGNCKIAFTDPSNILESGIDILASPPGKKVDSLFALSGGEKTLVALSVLFAILKTSHFPLVILDEAESALDPANVERFGTIISQFSKHTQFIIITHRPGTMERCQSLYGATMETKGVTSMYTMQIADAKAKYSQDNNA